MHGVQKLSFSARKNKLKIQTQLKRGLIWSTRLLSVLRMMSWQQTNMDILLLALRKWREGILGVTR